MSGSKTPFGIGIIGCGLIGKKRAKAIGHGGKLVACADTDFTRAKQLAEIYNAKAFNNYSDLVFLPEVDIVIVAVVHSSLATITLEAIKSGKHVLVEKPAGLSLSELEPLLEEQHNRSIKIHVGFNHRYHRALRQAKEIVDSGELGELMFIRGRYGHGARVGYEKEWRANPKLSGGGELIDQGSHLIDLSRWFLGEFTEVKGFAHTYYWDMPVDDNSFMILKTAEKKVAFLQASCTEWKNLFSMEIYGHAGKIDILGLGGSYGVESLTHYRMLPEMGPPEKTYWEYPMEDNSWEVEIAEFYKDIELDRTPTVGLLDAYESLKIVQKIYEESGYDYSKWPIKN